MLSRRLLILGLSFTAAGGLPRVSEAAPMLQGLPGVDQVIDRPSAAVRPQFQKPRKATVSVKPAKKAKARKTAKKPFVIDPMYAPQDIDFYTLFVPGTIIVNSGQKLLYLVQPGNKARRYGVAIGSQGLGWTGIAKIKGKVEWPSWKPTPDMLKRSPEKYLRYKDGMEGGPGNPLGARAMYLYQGKRDTQIRIHGTTQPWTIGQAASNGCFRMVNEHIIDLYERVKYGAPVIVI
jgi:lipoprotein-anchoring transpeptidase ErfK/SrfK